MPGTLHFVAKAPGHSFDHSAMNLSHSVGYFYFGNKPSPRRRKVRHLHVTCAGLPLDCVAYLAIRSGSQLHLCSLQLAQWALQERGSMSSAALCISFVGKLTLAAAAD